MEEIEYRWIVRKKIAPKAIKSKIFYSEEAALDFAEEHDNEWWITVEAYFLRYGVESMRRVIYRWVNLNYIESMRNSGDRGE